MHRDYVKASYDLITESVEKTNIRLTPECESYLVFLMAENFNRPSMGYDGPVAIEWMTIKNMAPSEEKKSKLKQLGDTCLMVSSISPFIYGRNGLGPEYFIAIGQDSYYTRSTYSDSEPWYSLYKNFLKLRDVFEAALIKRNYSIAQYVELVQAGSATAQAVLGATLYIPPNTKLN
jgi:hypothetical protein